MKPLKETKSKQNCVSKLKTYSCTQVHLEELKKYVTYGKKKEHFSFCRLPDGICSSITALKNPGKIQASNKKLHLFSISFTLLHKHLNFALLCLLEHKCTYSNTMIKIT